LNLMRDYSRWPERWTLIAEGLAALQADLIALQEVNLSPSGNNTAQWLADQLNNRKDGSSEHPYTAHSCPKTGKLRDREAIAILSRLPVEGAEMLDLQTQGRVAQWVRVRVGGRPLVFANGHYYWWPGEAAERVRQVQRLLDWLAALPPGTAIVACGDFNGTPESKAISLMRERFTSAYVACHGCEPEYTCPTPLARPSNFLRMAGSYLLGAMLNRSLKPWRGTLDYIFVNEHVRVGECSVILNQPAPHDHTLYPSDHFGLAATLELCS
ncbi:MAG: endonuclease/exonuclease/phosphatase family protein, partial [Anaerolineales bacterium]